LGKKPGKKKDSRSAAGERKNDEKAHRKPSAKLGALRRTETPVAPGTKKNAKEKCGLGAKQQIPTTPNLTTASTSPDAKNQKDKIKTKKGKGGTDPIFQETQTEENRAQMYPSYCFEEGLKEGKNKSSACHEGEGVNANKTGQQEKNRVLKRGRKRGPEQGGERGEVVHCRAQRVGENKSGGKGGG